MITESKYQLVSLDESILSDFSDENESTIVGGCCLRNYYTPVYTPVYYSPAPAPAPAPAPGTTIVNNNYNTNNITVASSASNCTPAKK